MLFIWYFQHLHSPFPPPTPCKPKACIVISHDSVGCSPVNHAWMCNWRTEEKFQKIIPAPVCGSQNNVRKQNKINRKMNRTIHNCSIWRVLLVLNIIRGGEEESIIMQLTDGWQWTVSIMVSICSGVFCMFRCFRTKRSRSLPLWKDFWDGDGEKCGIGYSHDCDFNNWAAQSSVWLTLTDLVICSHKLHFSQAKVSPPLCTSESPVQIKWSEALHGCHERAPRCPTGADKVAVGVVWQRIRTGTWLNWWCFGGGKGTILAAAVHTKILFPFS